MDTCIACGEKRETCHCPIVHGPWQPGIRHELQPVTDDSYIDDWDAEAEDEWDEEDDRDWDGEDDNPLGLRNDDNYG